MAIGLYSNPVELNNSFILTKSPVEKLFRLGFKRLLVQEQGTDDGIEVFLTHLNTAIYGDFSAKTPADIVPSRFLGWILENDFCAVIFD